MSTEVVMPQMGESIAEGTVSKWLKQVGDKVERDEPLLEISTDKVDAEIPSPAAGTLTEILAKEGDTVPVNAVVARIGDGGAAAASAAPVESPSLPVSQSPGEEKKPEQPSNPATQQQTTGQPTPPPEEPSDQETE